MNGADRDAQVRRLVGIVIKEWRETKLKCSVAVFAERYNMSDRFVRMVQRGQYLPSCMQFIRMVFDMDWKSRGKLMLGFARIKRQEFGCNQEPPAFPLGEQA